MKSETLHNRLGLDEISFVLSENTQVKMAIELIAQGITYRVDMSPEDVLTLQKSGRVTRRFKPLQDGQTTAHQRD